MNTPSVDMSLVYFLRGSSRGDVGIVLRGISNIPTSGHGRDPSMVHIKTPDDGRYVLYCIQGAKPLATVTGKYTDIVTPRGWFSQP